MVSSDNNMEGEQELVPTTARNPPQYPDVMRSVAKEGSKEKTPKRNPSHHIIVTNNNGNRNQVMVDRNDHRTIYPKPPFQKGHRLGNILGK